MQKRRRLQPEQSKALILEAAERLISNQGASALTVRGIATEAGMNPSLVRYYYETTQDLLIAFFQQLAEGHCRKIDEALKAEQPLQALWNLQTRAPSGLLTMEIMSLGHRYEALREQLVMHVEVVRTKIARALQEAFERTDRNPGTASPEGAAFVFLAVAAALVADRGLDITKGNAEGTHLVEAWIAGLESSK
ncbi:TetR/AcrR family transcriptional regulator [Sphingobium indicum]|uniref:TetR/AcrR family transcriptional regulator n=1 Tax=Sphingobium indicum TaxID=332055 RepID=UPI0005694783|nr:TetR/AcrR family transcriptional regulator [Sphingobium indicum]